MEGYYVGRVSSVDTIHGFVKVTYEDYNNIVSDWLPLQSFEYDMPETGSLVATVLDKFGRGICLGKVFSYSQPPKATGDWAKYIDGLTITKQGEIITIQFNAIDYIQYSTGKLKINCSNLEINGDNITINGNAVKISGLIGG